jgi:hypothetical protein
MTDRVALFGGFVLTGVLVALYIPGGNEAVAVLVSAAVFSALKWRK